MNDTRNWRIDDPDPGRPLEQITPLSRRAAALLARNAEHPLMRTDFIRIFGAVPMLEGLDYHHRQSLGHFERLARGGLSDAAHGQLLSALDHEAEPYAIGGVVRRRFEGGDRAWAHPNRDIEDSVTRKLTRSYPV